MSSISKLFYLNTSCGHNLLEGPVLLLGLASRPPSGLRGGGDRGTSRATVGTWDGGGAGDAAWTEATEAGAAVKDTAGEAGTTAPPPWTRAACWALSVAERWAGSALKPAVSCSTLCSRDSI
ncbi:hypothetical protein EYF80_016868 [Liparis tanakae]|uniref:Uncharacterized protein n=1 Tax=Liparis tanakae TaxID=230148 RepID=A0A4Z2I4E4_9TELE|nr:hypothetical protein EYF80_016868 [Liparis tanakae]